MLLQQIINGLTIGGIYALVALGYSMVYSILRIVNFAHGDILMMGTFFGLTFCQVMHLPFWASLILAAALTAVLGLTVERFAYRPIHSKDGLSVLISALGVSIFLQNLARLIWGSETFPYTGKIKTVTYKIGSVSISNINIIIMVLVVILLAALYIVVYKTKIGVAMRACSYDMKIARLMGINTNRIIVFTFGIGSVLAAVAGNLVGVYYDAVYASMGYSMGLKAFAAAILGGIGSIPGAVIGGVLIGVVESLGTAYFSSGYRDAYAFIVMILFLIIRPSGILGKKINEKV